MWGGQRGCTKAMLVAPSLATPKEPLESPGLVLPPTPITRAQSPGGHSRFIVSDRAPAKLARRAQPAARGEQVVWRPGAGGC